jgi:GH25 family lysozyme M1 (1,4-beta-N-acetylmuramidase)
MFKRFFAWLFKKKEPSINLPEVKPTPSPIEVPSETMPHKEAAQPDSEASIKPFLNFPDISHYEPCDFNKFNGNDLLTKATEGKSMIDGTLKFNMEQCKKKGIRFGAYHFYKTDVDPIIQANHFIKTVGLDNLKDFFYEPIVDYETTKGQTEADLKKAIPQLKLFIQEIYKQTGRWPMFYTYESLLVYLELDLFFTNCRLWIARYGKEPTKLAPWKEYWAWQFSDGEIPSPKYPDSFPGIGRCDTNIFKQ